MIKEWLRGIAENLINPGRAKAIADWEKALNHCLALIGDPDERFLFDLYARSEHLSVYQLYKVHDLLMIGIEPEQVLLALENGIPVNAIAGVIWSYRRD